MALITIPFTFSVGNTIIASQHNSNFQTVYNDYNGNITDVNVAANAAIEYTKLSLANTIKSSDILSSTVFAAANLGTGTPTSSTYLRGDGTWQSTVFGNSNVSGILGAWSTTINGVAITAGASLLANTDGFLLAFDTSNNSQVIIFTDGNNPPVTARCNGFSGTGGQSWGFSPVKKNDYVKVTNTVGSLVAYWISLGV